MCHCRRQRRFSVNVDEILLPLSIPEVKLLTSNGKTLAVSVSQDLYAKLTVDERAGAIKSMAPSMVASSKARRTLGIWSRMEKTPASNCAPQFCMMAGSSADRIVAMYNKEAVGYRPAMTIDLLIVV
jgi:hypothetical protein